jgi:hypothetical protein
VVNILYESEQVNQLKVYPLPVEVKKVVSILCGGTHYCVAVVTLKDTEIQIFDGLAYPVKTWKNHTTMLMKKCGLLPATSNAKF